MVSMGSVAASGGYWIAAEADEIWALPNYYGQYWRVQCFSDDWGVID